MEFVVLDEVFEKLDNYCVGLVVVKGIDNSKKVPQIAQMLNENISAYEQQFEGKKVKEAPQMTCYRDAFRNLGMNPNKFMPSIEALLTRIAKKKGFPSINPAVDLGNAVSIKYCLPLGAHDLGTIDKELSVRFSEPEDSFIAFGKTEIEKPDDDELVYVSDNEIRTRKWIWRQSEIGKITEKTNSIIFPIDGFTDINKTEVLAARDELASLLSELFNCEPVTGFIDKDHQSFNYNR